MKMEQGISRRNFLKSSAVSGLGLTLGFHLPFLPRLLAADKSGPATQELNAFLRIDPNGEITVLVKHLEMGQGVFTGLPQLVAEELGCSWEKISVASAPANAALYNNLNWGPMQGTGGSSSLANSWRQLREAGAKARELLISAAAEKWQVPRTEIRVGDAFLEHPSSGRKGNFGEFAVAAAKLPVPETVELRDIRKARLLGKNLARPDNAAKTNGSAIFGFDFSLPGMLVAMVERAPRFGGTVQSFSSEAALKVPGVLEVFKIPQGVVVIAKSFWSAKKGREALEIRWDEKAALKLSSSQIREQYRALLAKPGAVAGERGDVAQGMQTADKKVNAEYEFPFLAHAPMEPLSCTIRVRGGTCELWTGSQIQTGDQMAAAKILGIKMEKVKINTLFAGGSFGRRATPNSDVVSEAALIAKNTKRAAGKPIKLLWTREDDIRGGMYRPYFLHQVEAGVDKAGRPQFWNHRLVGQSILEGTPFAGQIKNGIDGASVEGVADLAYAVPNLRVELHSPRLPVPVLWWRSVGHTHTAFAAETMIDELAVLSGIDPVKYRMNLLQKHPRHLAALELAAKKAKWGSSLPKGWARGVAVHESFNSVVAAVVEATISEGKIKVGKVVYGVDCGFVVNPDNVRAQLEGGCGFALAAALHGEITFSNGKVVQSNFHDYPTLRLAEMPHVEAHTVPSLKDPTGIGEPGVPVVAPALANALFQLTGKRIRSLPFRLA